MRRGVRQRYVSQLPGKTAKKRGGISHPRLSGGEASTGPDGSLISKSQLETASKHGRLANLLTIGARRTRRGVVYDKKVMLVCEPATWTQPDFDHCRTLSGTIGKTELWEPNGCIEREEGCQRQITFCKTAGTPSKQAEPEIGYSPFLLRLHGTPYIRSMSKAIPVRCFSASVFRIFHWESEVI